MTDTVRRFRKKPVVVDAIRYSPHENCAEIAEFLKMAHSHEACVDGGSSEWIINTLEGEMVCRPGDWIIRGFAGEFYPCKDGIFQATYEEAR